MRVLCLGDIQWELPGGSGDDPTTDTDPAIIRRFAQAGIGAVDPDLVLFSGDVINDGMNQEEHVSEFLALLEFLEAEAIQSATIPGNHDEYSNYDAVVEKIEELEHATELSARVATLEGLTTAGIPYSYTNDLRRTRSISEEFPDHYDILLAHAARARRIWLFDVDADYIVTGHYSRELFELDGTVFASMGAFPGGIVVIDTTAETVEYRQHVESDGAFHLHLTRADVGDGLEWTVDPPTEDNPFVRDLRESSYKDLVLQLQAAKARAVDADAATTKDIVEELRAANVPKKHIREYIGRYDFL